MPEAKVLETGPADTVGKWLPLMTAAVGLIGTIGTGVAAVGGGLGRIVLNEFWWAIASFVMTVLALLAIALALGIFGADTPRHRGIRTILFGFSFLLFTGGIIIGGLAASLITATRGQPAIAATVHTVDGSLQLDGTVSTSGVKAGERIQVRVTGHRQHNKIGSRLYEAWIGPDSQGNVTTQIALRLDPTQYDEVFVAAWFDVAPTCDTDASTVGCALVGIPIVRNIPSLTATWADDAAVPTILVTVQMPAIAATSVVYMHAYGTTASGARQALYDGALGPSPDGTVDTTIRIRVPQDIVESCLVAYVGDGTPTGEDLDCGKTVDSQARKNTWARLSTPAVGKSSISPSADPSVEPAGEK
jgi:hypothetical protein